MQTIKKSLIATVLAGFVFGIILGLVSYWSRDISAQEFSGRTADTCRVVRQAVVVVGHQEPLALNSATTSNRAIVTVQQPPNATNTLSISFIGNAVSGQGLTLNRDVTVPDNASTTDTLQFGRNTKFPYNGTVSAITDVGSSTVNVVECVYL